MTSSFSRDIAHAVSRRSGTPRYFPSTQKKKGPPNDGGPPCLSLTRPPIGTCRVTRCRWPGRLNPRLTKSPERAENATRLDPQIFSANRRGWLYPSCSDSPTALRASAWSQARVSCRVSRETAWRMNTAETPMTSQSQKLKPSSTPSPIVRAMMRAKAPIVPQLRTRECDPANALPPRLPVERFISARRLGHNRGPRGRPGSKAQAQESG